MPKLSDVHPDAVLPRLDFNELFIFRSVHEGRLAKKSWRIIIGEIGVTKKKCDKVAEAVAKALLGPESLPGQLQIGKADGLAQKFCLGLKEILGSVRDLYAECKKKHGRRVVIEASEYCVLTLLPQIISRSGGFAGLPQLEIKRASYKRFTPHLLSGSVDLALGPEAPMPPEIISAPLFSVPRAIICHTAHKFRCGKAAADILLKDLAKETVFVLSTSAVPMFSMEKHLPRPKSPGRRVLIDSISHMYQYVREDLGVALGYSTRYASDKCGDANLCVKELTSHEIPPANFFLYCVANESQRSKVGIQFANVILVKAEEIEKDARKQVCHDEPRNDAVGHSNDS